MKSVAVFCGSSYGYEPRFRETAYQVGKTLAREGIEVVYGGTKLGLMGYVADGVIDGGGRIKGIIPTLLQQYPIEHSGLHEIITVGTITERKEMMLRDCEGFITLPGGFGSLDEIFHVLAQAQLNVHSKPVGLLNANGFYDELLAMIRKMERYGFMRSAARNILLDATTIDELLDKMRNYQNPEKKKFFHKDIL
ncbi:TIGR00730 family Rossman fold protein [Porphyromonadaceae bacterium]